jgi:hypothetical protein
MPVVERTVVVFLDVVSFDKYLDNLSRAVRNLSNVTKPKTIFLTKCVSLLFLQEIQFHTQFKEPEYSIIREIIILLSKFITVWHHRTHYESCITNIGNINLAPDLLHIYGSDVLFCGLLPLGQVINLIPQ